MHESLPWIDGPRTSRPVLPRVWAPSSGRVLEVVILAPFRRLAVHWNGTRHQLHFPGACPGCDQSPEFEEHGYAAALVRWADPRFVEVQNWQHGVVQLTQGPLMHVVFRSTEPWTYLLRRNNGNRSMVSVDRRPCQRVVWLLGRPFDPSPTLERLYGTRWKDAQGKLTGASVDPRGRKEVGDAT